MIGRHGQAAGRHRSDRKRDPPLHRRRRDLRAELPADLAHERLQVLDRYPPAATRSPSAWRMGLPQP
jgi:hypothetical protein